MEFMDNTIEGRCIAVWANYGVRRDSLRVQVAFI
jgi:hypothetical protein